MPEFGCVPSVHEWLYPNVLTQHVGHTHGCVSGHKALGNRGCCSPYCVYEAEEKASLLCPRE